MSWKRAAAFLLVAGSAGLSTALLSRPQGDAAGLHAAPISHTADLDRDGLPDALEAVLLIEPGKRDTDLDGVDDLTEFLAGSSGRLCSSTKSCGEGFRLGVSSEEMRFGMLTERVFWLHLVFKVGSGSLASFQGLGLFIHMDGTILPLDPYFKDPRNVLNIRTDEISGSRYGTLSVRVGMGPSAYPLSIEKPFQFCLVGRLANRTLCSATYLDNIGGVYVQLVPFQPGGLFAYSAINPSNPQLAKWDKDCQICLVKKEVAGVTPGKVIYEITSAKCVNVTVDKACMPGCEGMSGSVVVGLDGWGLVGI